MYNAGKHNFLRLGSFLFFIGETDPLFPYNGNRQHL